MMALIEFLHLCHYTLDANECLKSNGNCSQICENTEGSYSCMCDAGYMLDLDRLSCRGIMLTLSLIRVGNISS